MKRDILHVQGILRDYPEARESDEVMFGKYVDEYFKGDFKKALKYCSIASLIRFRRRIQNDRGLFVPSQATLDYRRIKEAANHKRRT